MNTPAPVATWTANMLLGGALLLAGGQAWAEERGGFYAGTGAGIYYYELDDFDFDETAGSLRVFGGYRLGNYLGFEAGYNKYFEANGDLFGAEVDIDGSALDVSVRPTLPVADYLEVFGIVGWADYDLDVSASFGGSSVTVSESDSELFYGVGAGLHLTERLAVRGEWTIVDVEDADFGTLSVAATYRF